MKHLRLITVVLITLVTQSVSAKFTIKEPGILVDSTDNSKEFTVAQFGTLSQNEAVKKISQLLNLKFCEPNDKLTIDDNIITIDGYKLNRIGDKGLGLEIPGFFHIIYKIVITVRDGRAKVEIPVCKLAPSQITKPNNENQLLNGENISDMYFYNNKGKLKKKYTAEKLLSFVNNIVSIIESVENQTNASNDDW